MRDAPFCAIRCLVLALPGLSTDVVLGRTAVGGLETVGAKPFMSIVFV